MAAQLAKCLDTAKESSMTKKVLAAAIAMALLGFATLSFAPDAEARKGRRCPRGFEDVNDVCVPAPNHR